MALTGSEIKVFLYGPKEKTATKSSRPRKPSNRKRTEAILIKKGNKSTYAGMLKKVKEEVKHEGLNVKRVKETRSGDLIMSIKKTDQTRRIAESMKAKFGDNHVQWIKGGNIVLHIRNIDGIATAEEIYQDILKSRRRKRRRNHGDER